MYRIYHRFAVYLLSNQPFAAAIVAQELFVYPTVCWPIVGHVGVYSSLLKVDEVKE
jgi:hypothetical protein